MPYCAPQGGAQRTLPQLALHPREVPVPTEPAGALRLRRPRWRDPRLLIGIALVLVSVLAGILVITRLSATTTVLVARTDVVVGSVLRSEDLTTAQLRLGEQTPQYASSLDQIPAGAVATETIRAGHLLPVSAIGQGEGVQLRPVVIEVDAAIARSVAPGARVEVWSTPEQSGQEERAQAVRLVDSGVVRTVDEGSSLGMQSTSVEVLIPADEVPVLLEALAADDRLDVIAIPGARDAGS